MLEIVNSIVDLVRTKSDFATASGAAPDSAVVARVADAVCELGLEADVAGGRELYARRTVHLIASTDRLLQHCDFILLTSAAKFNVRPNVTF